MHPALRIGTFVLLAIAVQRLPPAALAVCGAAVAAVAALGYRAQFGRMLRRSRWLLFTMLLVFACATPGEFMLAGAGWSPTYEGLNQGLLQAGRLAVILAGLAILLGSTPREALLAGMYPLLRPCRWLGLAPERFAARLWLTLHYAEHAPAADGKSLWQRFDDAGTAPAAPMAVGLESWRVRRRDWLFGGLLLAAAGALWL